MATIDTMLRSSVRRPSREAFGDRFTIVLTGLATRVEQILAKRRSRRALLEMTDEQLKDIGISRADAYREGVRSIWE